VISISIFYFFDTVYNSVFLNNGLLVFVFILPILEEIGKTFLLILFLRHFKFKTVTEGFMYGAILGLGFAISENIYLSYVNLSTSGVEAAISTIIIRTLILLVGHPLYTGIIGSSISVAARSVNYSAWSQIFKMTLLHMSWNFVAFWLSQFDLLLYLFGFIVIVSIGISLYIKEKNFVHRFDLSLKLAQRN
jgi:RsiW-degrading membrane proteinase PrsW (M82 family)